MYIKGLPLSLFVMNYRVADLPWCIRQRPDQSHSSWPLGDADADTDTPISFEEDK